MDTSDRIVMGRTLTVGSLLLLAAGFITPGRLLIERTSGLDMAGMNQVLVDNAVLTNVSAVAAILAFGLIIYALVKMWPFTQSLDGRIRFLAQLGLTLLMVFFATRLLQRGVNHVVVHVSEHGAGGEVREQVVTLLALGAQTTGLILRYVGGTLGLIGLALFAWSMSTVFNGGFHKVAAIVMAVYSVIGFVGLMLAEHIHGLDLALLGNIYTSLRILVVLWLAILGAAFYKGRVELSPA